MAEYLVTGGAGFCGFEIVKLLISRKNRVTVIDLDNMPQEIRGVKHIKADIRELDSMSECFKDIDYVIHAAAKVPISRAGKEFWDVNVSGTRNVLEQALRNKIKKVVYISSSSVQSSDKNPIKESDPYNPIGEYAKSKVESEIVCREYIKKGLKIDIIRPRTTVGPGRLGIFDILFSWIKEGRKIYIIGKGNNRLQLLHVKDLAECCYLSSRDKGSNIFNIGSKSFSTLREDLTSLINHAKTKSKIISLPILPARIILGTLDILRLSPLTLFHYMTYNKDYFFDNKNPEKILGWKPKYGNREILETSYDKYMGDIESKRLNYGTTHRRGLKQGVLGILRKIS